MTLTANPTEDDLNSREPIPHSALLPTLHPKMLCMPLQLSRPLLKEHRHPLAACVPQNAATSSSAHARKASRGPDCCRDCSPQTAKSQPQQGQTEVPVADKLQGERARKLGCTGARQTCWSHEGRQDMRTAPGAVGRNGSQHSQAHAGKAGHHAGNAHEQHEADALSRAHRPHLRFRHSRREVLGRR